VTEGYAMSAPGFLRAGSTLGDRNGQIRVLLDRCMVRQPGI